MGKTLCLGHLHAGRTVTVIRRQGEERWYETPWRSPGKSGRWRLEGCLVFASEREVWGMEDTTPCLTQDLALPLQFAIKRGR